jgi:uncharacterized protein
VILYPIFIGKINQTTLAMVLAKYLFPFFRYLGSPIVPQRVKPFKSIIFFIYLFLFSLLMDSALEYITTRSYLLKIFHITNINTFDDDIYREGLVFAVIGVGMIAPAIEELLQRYYLTSFTWNNTILPLSFGFILVQLFNIESTIGLLIVISLTVILSILIYRGITKSPKFKIRFLRFYTKNYWLFFYTSSISFGVAHIGNYHIQHFVPILPVILVLPQIFAGLLLGYIRIVMGLRWSIAFHSFHNLVFVTFLFINHRS